MRTLNTTTLDDKKSKGVESETAFAGNITGC